MQIHTEEPGCRETSQNARGTQLILYQELLDTFTHDLIQGLQHPDVMAARVISTKLMRTLTLTR